MFRRTILALAVVALALPAAAQDRTITIASTTSTDQSGLFGHILPMFTRETGITARVVALGTGQALDVGRRGDADVVFVHDRAAEERFLREGFSTERRHVMFNDFVLVGPAGDPAQVNGLRDTPEALGRIAAARAPFVSRGDRSGTHAAELRLWKQAGVDPATGRGQWYREVGQGMGPALNTAAAQNAYVLADRGTWLSFRNRQDLRIVVEGDTRLFNQYGVMLVNPQRHAHVKAADGQRFIDWILSPAGQAAGSTGSNCSSRTRRSQNRCREAEGRPAASSRRHPVDRLGQRHVARAEPAGIMRAERDLHPVPHIRPFRVVVLLLRQKGHAGHEAPRLAEVGEAEAARDGVAPRHHRPAGQVRGQSCAARGVQFIDHPCLPLLDAGQPRRA